MNTATFPCPHCLSPLRIQDRAFVEREVGCPECGEQIEVTLNRDKEPVARKVSADKSETALSNLPPKRSQRKKSRSHRKGNKPASKSKPKDASNSPPRVSRQPLIQLGERFSGVPEVLLSPVGIAWTVAGLVALALLILAWPRGGVPVGEISPGQVAEASEAEPQAIDSPFEEPSLEDVIPSPDLPDAKGVPEEGVVVARLTQLGTGLQSYVDQRGHFPAGTVSQGNQPVKDRFGWLAEMFVQSSRGRIAEPQWDQPWNDPLNDRFVRQQREAVLNPLIARRVGADRYPATHFVGVAGVGPDAPFLPVDDRRAGIFGVDRITKPKDIKDGLANTMMVAGVMSDLGSWSAGKASLRAFTQEPYFEGPDGFGTGEAEGMSVLMADGSVRFLSKTTDPLIVRRLAAMADGWPLDETIPGEPGDLPPQKSQSLEPPEIVQTQPKPQHAAVPKPERPPEPLPPPEEPEPESEPQEPVDIPAVLAVKLVKFEQVKDAPFKELLFQVEELCGVPIRRGEELPGIEAEFWNKGVSLQLKDASVRQILESLLEKANLGYTIESDHIRLHAID